MLVPLLLTMRLVLHRNRNCLHLTPQAKRSVAPRPDPDIRRGDGGLTTNKDCRVAPSGHSSQ